MDFIYNYGELKPFWTCETVTAETVILTESNGEASGTLWRVPKKIINVTDYRRQTEYISDRDFTVSGNTIKLTKNSPIAFIPKVRLVGEYSEDDYQRFPTIGRVDTTHYGEDTLLPNHQICVTYTYDNSSLDFSAPKYQLDRLPALKAKFAKKEKIKILFYGDSISTGCNTSGMQNIPPFMPSWMELVSDNLAKHYGCYMDYVNTAVGGMDSCWGLEHLNENVISHNADLVVLAFGMNDGVVYSCKKFGDTITEIVKKTQTANPNTEFVLVSSMLPNPYAATNDFKPFFGNQLKYGKVLKHIEKSISGTAFCDVGTIHESLLKSKYYADMLVNNINHPNDYLAKIYAMVILQTLIL